MATNIRVGTKVRFLPHDYVLELLAKLCIGRGSDFAKQVKVLQGVVFTVVEVDRPGSPVAYLTLQSDTGHTYKTLDGILIGADCVEVVTKYPTNHA